MIEETGEEKGVAQVMAKVPLANLFGYTNDLRSATCARRRRARRASRWSSATTPRCARSWPTCRRRRRRSGKRPRARGGVSAARQEPGAKWPPVFVRRGAREGHAT
jgi:hypothetical protein